MGSVVAWIRRRPRLAAATALVVAALGYLVNAWPEIRISYHRRQMQAYNDWADNGTPVPGGRAFHVTYKGAGYEEADRHRDQLVALGAIARLDYAFSRLEPRTPAAERLMVDIDLKNSPPYLDFQYSDYRPPPEPLRATIFCEHERVEAWRRFFAERDVADTTVPAPSAK